MGGQVDVAAANGLSDAQLDALLRIYRHSSRIAARGRGASSLRTSQDPFIEIFRELDALQSGDLLSAFLLGLSACARVGRGSEREAVRGGDTKHFQGGLIRTSDHAVQCKKPIPNGRPLRHRTTRSHSCTPWACKFSGEPASPARGRKSVAHAAHTGLIPSRLL